MASNPASGKLFTWKSLLIAALLGLWIGSTLGVGITCNVMSDDETAGNPATTLYVMGGETELNALDLTANQEGLLSGEFATKLAKASGMKDLRIWTPDLIGKEGLQVLTLEILDGQLKLSWDQRSPTIENCPSKNKDKDFACLPEGLQVKMEKVDTYNGEAFKAKVTTDMLAYLFRKDEDGPAEAVPTAVPATTAETPKPASGKRRKPAPADPAPAPAEAEKPKPAKEPSAFDQLK